MQDDLRYSMMSIQNKSALLLVTQDERGRRRLDWCWDPARPPTCLLCLLLGHWKRQPLSRSHGHPFQGWAEFLFIVVVESIWGDLGSELHSLHYPIPISGMRAHKGLAKFSSDPECDPNTSCPHGFSMEGLALGRCFDCKHGRTYRDIQDPDFRPDLDPALQFKGGQWTFIEGLWRKSIPDFLEGEALANFSPPDPHAHCDHSGCAGKCMGNARRRRRKRQTHRQLDAILEERGCPSVRLPQSDMDGADPVPAPPVPVRAPISRKKRIRMKPARDIPANMINLTNSFQGLCCEGDACDAPCSHDLETKIDDGPPELVDSERHRRGQGDREQVRHQRG